MWEKGEKKREKMVIKDVEQLPDMTKFRQSWTFYPEKKRSSRRNKAEIYKSTEKANGGKGGYCSLLLKMTEKMLSNENIGQQA